MRECLDEGMLQSYCDGELAGSQVDGVTAHLAHCSSCSALADELFSENDIVFAALAPEFQAAVPTERLRQRIDEAISSLQAGNTASRPLLQRASGWFASLGGLFTLRPQAFGYASLVAVLAFTAIFGLAYFRSAPAPNVNNNAAQSAPAAEPAQPTAEAVDPTGSEVQPKPTPPPQAVSASQPTRQFKKSASVANKTVAGVKLLPGERSYLKTIAALDSTIKAAGDRPMRPELRAEYERNLALVDRALAAARSAAKSNPDDPDAAEFVFTAYQSKVDLLNTVADARVYNRQP